MTVFDTKEVLFMRFWKVKIISSEEIRGNAHLFRVKPYSFRRNSYFLRRNTYLFRRNAHLRVRKKRHFSRFCSKIEWFRFWGGHCAFRSEMMKISVRCLLIFRAAFAVIRARRTICRLRHQKGQAACPRWCVSPLACHRVSLPGVSAQRMMRASRKPSHGLWVPTRRCPARTGRTRSSRWRHRI